MLKEIHELFRQNDDHIIYVFILFINIYNVVISWDAIALLVGGGLATQI
jgi:hypothetical protein